MLVVSITIHGRGMLRKRQHRFQRPAQRPARLDVLRLPVAIAMLGLLAATGGGRAFAQTAAGPGGGDPVLGGETTEHSAFRVAVGAVRALELVAEAGSVTVADPEIADVVPAGGKRLIVMGRTTGQTGLLVHDRQGGALLNATIVVTPERDRTVTVNRGVEEDRMICAPDCVSTRPPGAAGGGGGGGNAAANPAAQAAEAMKGLQDAMKPK